jgi:ankyrin repeat protein
MEEFSIALREGDVGTVLRLVDADPTLLETVVDAWPRPLAVAAWHGHIGVARLLIERGANINATGSGGITALHCAAQEGHAEAVDFLLKKGAHANIKNQYGMTPLMWACNNGHLGAAGMLVQHMGSKGFDESSDRGWTALHYAADEGHEEVVRLLLVAGADPSITGDMGRAPRALAEEIHYLPIRR